MFEADPPAMGDLTALRTRIQTSFDELSSHRWRLAGVALIVLVGLVGLMLSSRGLRERDVDVVVPPSVQTTLVETTSVETTVASDRLVVQVAGAVAMPGVYRVDAGARVGDVVDAAGGLATDADVDRVNLAAKVADGQRVFVVRRGQAIPSVDELGSSQTSEPPSGPVDLNVATVADLERLPGIGPATAQAIVDHRSRHGPFGHVRDLMKVKGIGPAKFAQLQPRVTV